MLPNEDILNQAAISEPVTARQRLVAINSTILFLLAYLLVYLASQLATVAAAFSARIPTVFYPGHLEFKIADAAWRKADVIKVYAAAPVTALALAFGAALLFIWFRKSSGLHKTFFLWTFLHGCNLFFGSLMAGTLTHSGFWYTIRWSGFSETATWVTAFLFLLLLIGIGVLAAPAFLLSCDSISLMEYQNRSKMLSATVVWPWLAGSFLLMVLKFPDLTFFELLLVFTLLLLLLPVYFFNRQNLYSETVEMPKRMKLAQGALVTLILLAAVFRFLLQNGRLIG